ncbi:M4 family metallopeptidase [Streptomyces sp. LP05-1]|uniref:Neutral metalloproteinase n=1 Tax=Streptomyces pyxinae TaxID=2970734 RepID=A0ABT2CG95_9ACTN|nr:M4 family metallopeptidase [Streptomyces sp. LP05-1]MCS0636445.1 M4 family metallopeptidase [Streptomyces sp. LP05-1]
MRGAPIRRVAVAVVMATTSAVVAGTLGTAAASPHAASPSPGGSASQKAPANVVAAADAAAHAHPGATGVGADDTLTATEALVDPDGKAHVRFARAHDGLPVLGADLIVHLDAAHRYLSVTRATAHQVDVPTTTPKKSAADAQATAAAAGQGTAGKPTLVVSALAGQAPVLAYQVRVADSRTTEDGGARTVVVDATTGKVLSNAPVKDSFLSPGVLAKLRGAAKAPAAPSGSALASGRTAQAPRLKAAKAAAAGTTATGYSLYDGTVSLNASPYTYNGTQYYILRDASRGNTEVRDAYDQEINSFDKGYLAASTSTSFGNGATSDRNSAAVDAMYGITSTFDFYKSTFGRNGIRNDGTGAHGMVHYGNKVGNAYWDPDCGCMLYGDGDGSTFKKPLVVLDVTGHELTHGVVDATANLQPTRVDSRGNQYGEPGSLNESLADIFGSGVEFATNNAKNPPNYLMGEKLGLSQGFLRRLDQPSLDKLEGTVDYWSRAAYDTEVHAGSGVSSHAFYLLAEGSGRKTIGGVAYNSATYDGSTVAGIGRSKALAIYYRALTRYMVSTTDFHGARTATLNAAKDLYGASSAEYQAVNKSWAAVNVTASNG